MKMAHKREVSKDLVKQMRTKINELADKEDPLNEEETFLASVAYDYAEWILKKQEILSADQEASNLGIEVLP